MLKRNGSVTVCYNSLWSALLLPSATYMIHGVIRAKTRL